MRSALAMAIVPGVMFLFALGCKTQTSEKEKLFNALHNQLELSSQAIEYSNGEIYQLLEERLEDPVSNFKAGIWLPKANQVKHYSQQILSFLYEYKSELSGHEGQARSKNSKRDRRLLIDSLKQYKNRLMAIDTVFKALFDSSIVIEEGNSVASGDQTLVFYTEALSTQMSAVEKLALISQYQNNIRCVERRLITFCLNKVPHPEIGWFDSYVTFAGLSSSCAYAGQSIELVAGIGAFSKKAKPEISVNGKPLELYADGATHYQFKAPAKPGTYLLDVKFDYTHTDGSKMSERRMIEYKVR